MFGVPGISFLHRSKSGQRVDDRVGVQRIEHSAGSDIQRGLVATPNGKPGIVAQRSGLDVDQTRGSGEATVSEEPEPSSSEPPATLHQISRSTDRPARQRDRVQAADIEFPEHCCCSARRSCFQTHCPAKQAGRSSALKCR